MKSWLKIAAAAAFAIGSLSGRASAQANLIVNGSFELPSIPAGAFLAVGTGNTEITGWGVINQFGGTGNVALVDSTFAASSFEFPAQDGAQWLNLTDFTGNLRAGVQQVVATVPGTLYNLSFQLGTIQSASDFLSGEIEPETSVGLLISALPGPFPQAFSNLFGTSLTVLSWRQSNVSFTATESTTTIAFFNLDLPNDVLTGLDNVVMTAVPEPGIWSLMLAGVGLVALAARRQRAGASL